MKPAVEGTIAALPDFAAGLPDAKLSDTEFELFRALVYARAGIALGPHKRHLLHARLSRRLRVLGLGSFKAYYDYLMDPVHADEVVRFVNAITTNKTDFFREPHHFTYLAERWARERQAESGRGASRRLRIWCAASSTGEEPYTIAMVLSEAGLVPPAWDLKILASDIDTDVLGQASDGIYPMERTAPIPEPLLKRYFLRRVAGKTEVRVRPELRQLITFRQVNLVASPWPFRGPFDAIFCRNTLIYFDREKQRSILERLVAVLRPGGVLFLGHAESIFGLVEGLTHLGNTIYRRTGGAGQGERT